MLFKAKGSHIKLAKVDATVEKSLAEKYGVSGFPTLKIMRNGRRFEYNGPRDAFGIVKYMEEQALPAAKKLGSLGEVQRFMEKEDVTIVAFFESESSKVFEAFSDAAEMLRE
ncbi:thioredoxin, partial [Oesophagostomum dentatum]